MRFRPTVMERFQRQYGDLFTVRMPYGKHGSMVTMVVLADAALIREVFAGPADLFHAGEGNISLLEVMGEHSLLLLDEGDHTRAKKLIMPAFTGQALGGYRAMVADLARAEVVSWPSGKRIDTLDRMHAITLEVILRVVFGVADERRLAALRPLVRRVANVDLPAMLAWRYPSLRAVPPWSSYAKAQAALDELLYAEIAERRAAGHDETRTDLLTRLMAPTPDGDALSDAELRDQLVTFLLAGHETTATALTWTLHELAHDAGLMARAQRAADARDADGDAFFDALVKETMRLRPVVYDAARILTRPVQIGDYTIPAGVMVSPALGLMGIHPEHHTDPEKMDPDRFLGANPAPGTWIPFGGGARRCIGAGFSLMESVAILRTILQEQTLRAVDRTPDRLRPHGIINRPHRGARLTAVPRADRVAVPRLRGHDLRRRSRSAAPR